MSVDVLENHRYTVKFLLNDCLIFSFLLKYIGVISFGLVNSFQLVDFDDIAYFGPYLEPAIILLTFELQDEVYFVLREQPNAQNFGCQYDDPAQPRSFRRDQRGASKKCQTDVARLVRICKGDPGGLPHVSSERFATFAKAHLTCTAIDEDGVQFSYTHITSAHWDNSSQRLFATFTTEKSAPTGSAFCVYGIKELEESFKGPMLRTNSVGSTDVPLPVPNSFANICSRFHSQNLTNEEVAIGRRISLTFPYRYLPVKPMYGRALASQTGQNWIHIQAYRLPPLLIHQTRDDIIQSSIVWIASATQLTQFALYEKHISNSVSLKERIPSLCKLKEIHLGRGFHTLLSLQINPDRHKLPKDYNSKHFQTDLDNNNQQIRKRRSIEQFQHEMLNNRKQNEEITQIKISGSKLYIVTNYQLFWLPLARCSEYRTFNVCQQSKDPHCGWNWPEGSCTSAYEFDPIAAIDNLHTFSPSIDPQTSKTDQCQSTDQTDPEVESIWTPWYPCSLMSQPKQEKDTTLKFYPRYMNDQHALGSCLCRICLSQTECILGAQQVKNCTRYDQNWLPWSHWSQCDQTKRIQVRQRQCPTDTICIGRNTEYRPCASDSVWFKQADSFPIQAAFRSYNMDEDMQLFPNHSQKQYSLTQLILIVTSCTLAGVVITCILFVIFTRTRLIYPQRYQHITSAKKKNDWKGELEYNESQNPLTCKTAMQESFLNPKYWILSDDKKNIWVTKTDKNPRYTHFVPDTYLNKPVVKEPRIYTTDDKCSCSRVSPSPLSMASSPLTDTTLLKDKFTFDGTPDPSLSPYAEVNPELNVTFDLNSTTNGPHLFQFNRTYAEPKLNKNLLAIPDSTGNSNWFYNSSLNRIPKNVLFKQQEE